jgi:hypothetical protein
MDCDFILSYYRLVIKLFAPVIVPQQLEVLAQSNVLSNAPRL